MELYGTLGIQTLPGPAWTELVLTGTAGCPPGSSIGFRALVSLPAEGWEAVLNTKVVRDSQGMVTLRVRGARTEF